MSLPLPARPCFYKLKRFDQTVDHISDRARFTNTVHVALVFSTPQKKKSYAAYIVKGRSTCWIVLEKNIPSTLKIPV